MVQSEQLRPARSWSA